MSKETFETVFDYNITDKEAEVLFYQTTGCKTVEDFRELTSQRRKEFGGDFFSFVELSVLFRLRGDKEREKLYGSIRINDQWRIVFEFKNGGADNVRITDYH